MEEQKENRQEDDLATAEGCGFGVLVGLLIWICIIHVILYIIRN